MILACGTGEPWQDLWRNAVAGTTDVAADSQPTPFKLGYARFWLRGSRINLPIGGNVTADWLKAASCLRAFDEVVTNQISPSEIEWWESVLPAIGSNDRGGPASEVIVFLAGNPGAPYVDRWVRAALANPKVIIGVEGYHQGSLYTTMDDLRYEERAWLSKMTALGAVSRCAIGISVADAPWYAAANAAYCSASNPAHDADEEAVYDWLGAGCQHVFVWGYSYATERSRWLASDAIYRGIRRRWGVAP